ncbi:MAG: DUF5522 domain-containing protein [Bacteroidota bacterium]
MKELIEGIHYYFNADGYVVLTGQYHLEKGFCCGYGCLHCPYEYENVEEPRRSGLISQRNINGEKSL